MLATVVHAACSLGSIDSSRADSPTARLTISDWADERTPGGPVGQELMHNFIQVQPYMASAEK